MNFIWSTLAKTLQLLSQGQNFTATFSPAKDRGRPRRVITHEQLEYLQAIYEVFLDTNL